MKIETKMIDLGWNEVIKNYRFLDKKAVKTGFFLDKSEEGHKVNILSLVNILTDYKWKFQEWCFDKYLPFYCKYIDTKLRKRIFSSPDILKNLGEEANKKQVTFIKMLKNPPNAENYAKWKGRNDPLIGKKSIVSGVSLLGKQVFTRIEEEK